MRPGSWVHAPAAPPHQAFTSDPAGVLSDAVRFCPFATGNDIVGALRAVRQGRSSNPERAMNYHNWARQRPTAESAV
jgi:hypothetical protein